MKLAILMDPLFRINPKKDSSLAMIKAAQDLSWDVFIFSAETIVSSPEGAAASFLSIRIDLPLDALKCADFSFQDSMAASKNSFENLKIEAQGMLNLNSFDIILMRKDPPFNTEYLLATYALDLAEKAGVLVANRPQSIRNFNEKFSILNFPQCTVSTIVSADMKILRAFWEKHHNLILKPLTAMGGESVFHIAEDGRNLSVILESLTKFGTLPIMAQVYIPDIVSLGDKRIILINGSPFDYCLARIPEKGELRGNLAAGARGQVMRINERDRFICEQLKSFCQEQGLYLVGIDVIGDYLTEINVTSPTCLREIDREIGSNIARDYLLSLSALKESSLPLG